MEWKWTLKIHCFEVLKWYEFIVKNRVWAAWASSKKYTICEKMLLFKKHVLLQPMVLSQQELDLWGLQIDFFSIFGVQFKCFVRTSFECSKEKIIEKTCKDHGFVMIRRVDVCRKTWSLELKMWSKLTYEKHIFFKAIFRNRHFVQTVALFSEVPGAKKLRTKLWFL